MLSVENLVEMICNNKKSLKMSNHLLDKTIERLNICRPSEKKELIESMETLKGIIDNTENMLETRISSLKKLVLIEHQKENQNE